MFERNRCYAHVNRAIELQYQHCAVKCDGKPIVDVSDAVNLADNPTATQNSRTPMQSEKKIQGTVRQQLFIGCCCRGDDASNGVKRMACIYQYINT